jgi:hypothetical protein
MTTIPASTEKSPPIARGSAFISRAERHAQQQYAERKAPEEHAEAQIPEVPVVGKGSGVVGCGGCARDNHGRVLIGSDLSVLSHTRPARVVVLDIGARRL